ncbi:hypothetical protein A7U43_28560 (plasmid) [Mycobacterium adipatum]|uniref:Uncharacterized protein n=1 Tax=Mycobacterium adipatum TaxID=1682113 RepID=A0A172UWQ5_9MYCO|nr:hypothetical protein [Mycobacterium adipatum]ANE83465.1 hypothetical protein A7U43_28560 [Mycobacterium adipatum]
MGLLLFGVLPGCAANGYPLDPAHLSASVSAEDAAAFGNVALPAGAHVVDVRSDSGRDIRYQLTLIMTTTQLAELLQQFPGAAAEHPAPETLPPTVAVPVFFQDQITTEGGVHVNREVMVSDVAADEVYVHLSLYTT